MVEPMTPQEALDYAPQWGSYIRNGDPGACMYGLNDDGRPMDAYNRDLMVSHIDSDLLPYAEQQAAEGHAEFADDPDKLRALRAYLVGLQFDKSLGRGASVGYSVDRTGYTVRVYDPDANIVHEYSAGNSPWDSQAFIPPDRKEQRVPVQTLRKYARQTAQEIAAEYGVNLAMIHEEESE